MNLGQVSQHAHFPGSYSGTYRLSFGSKGSWFTWYSFDSSRSLSSRVAWNSLEEEKEIGFVRREVKVHTIAFLPGTRWEEEHRCRARKVNPFNSLCFPSAGG